MKAEGEAERSCWLAGKNISLCLNPSLSRTIDDSILSVLPVSLRENFLLGG